MSWAAAMVLQFVIDRGLLSAVPVGMRSMLWGIACLRKAEGEVGLPRGISCGRRPVRQKILRYSSRLRRSSIWIPATLLPLASREGE